MFERVSLGGFLWFWYGSNAHKETNSILVIIYKWKNFCKKSRNTLRKSLKLTILLTVGNIWTVRDRCGRVFYQLVIATNPSTTELQQNRQYFEKRFLPAYSTYVNSIRNAKVYFIKTLSDGPLRFKYYQRSLIMWGK